MGPDAMILVFWMLSFKPTLSLSSFTFIKRLFSSSSLSAIRVVSSAYLRLLIFLPEILIPACASSRPAFLMIYSAYNSNKQGDKTWHTLFPIWNQSVVPVLTVASFTCIQVSQEAGQVVWYTVTLMETVRALPTAETWGISGLMWSLPFCHELWVKASDMHHWLQESWLIFWSSVHLESSPRFFAFFFFFLPSSSSTFHPGDIPKILFYMVVRWCNW